MVGVPDATQTQTSMMLSADVRSGGKHKKSSLVGLASCELRWANS